jgi:genome
MRFKDYNLKVVTVERASTEYNMTINNNFVTFSKVIIQELDYLPMF